MNQRSVGLVLIVCFSLIVFSSAMCYGYNETTTHRTDLNRKAALDESGSRLFVANPQLNTVSVFDVASATPGLLTTVPVGGSPRGVAAGPGNGSTWRTC